MFGFVWRKSHLMFRLRLQIQLTKQFGQRKPITDAGWEREKSALCGGSFNSGSRRYLDWNSDIWCVVM